MKKNKTTLITLGVIFTSQIIYLLLPFSLKQQYLILLRPVIYGAVTIAFYVFTGLDERPVIKRRKAEILAVISVIFYLSAMLITGIIFGLAKNMMFGNLTAVLRSIWIHGSVLILSELLRLGVVKSTLNEHRLKISAVLILIYVFTSIEDLSGLANIPNFFFGEVFPLFVLNWTLTYVAYESTFKTLLIIGGTYTLAPYVLPFVPDTPLVAWKVIEVAVLFVTTAFYRINMRDSDKSRIEKRKARYQRKHISVFIIPALALSLFLAFNLRAFTYFPAVVISGSMTGTIDKGSVVFVRKISEKDVFKTVQIGDVIYFKHNDKEWMHRVIDFDYNENGERVYITKGDANPITDASYVEANQILGMVKTYIPYIGYPFTEG